MSALTTLFHFTPTEEIIYATICQAEGQLVTYEDLASVLWDYPSPSDRAALRSHVHNMRNKLPPSEADLIGTMVGYGYYWGTVSPPRPVRDRSIPTVVVLRAWANIEAQRRAR